MYTNTYLNSEQLQKSVIEIFYFTRSIFLSYNKNIRLHYISSRVHSRSNQFAGSRRLQLTVGWQCRFARILKFLQLLDFWRSSAYSRKWKRVYGGAGGKGETDLKRNIYFRNFPRNDLIPRVYKFELFRIFSLGSFQRCEKPKETLVQ